MTVEEHILFYSLLKGRPTAEAEEEVENMVQDLGLPHKRAELIQNLSGLFGNWFKYQLKPPHTLIPTILWIFGVF